MLRDSPERYGTVSRILHWGMAALLAWQFAGMALRMILGRVPLMAFWVGTHVSVGTLLLLLVLLRAAWALAQRRRRPQYPAGPAGRLAGAGHLLLYALMIAIPALALLRQFGSGRGVTLFGIEVQRAGGEPVPWMTAPANLLHGNLAWLLLALIVGHVLMALIHRYLWKDDTLARMTGRGAIRVRSG